MTQRLKIEVSGIVQGVGFRPYVYRLAHRLSLSGFVHNSEFGVVLEIQGEAGQVSAFLSDLPREAPPLAHLLEIRTSAIAVRPDSDFVIRETTHSTGSRAIIPPDIATCEDCVREMRDPSDRRYRYPFINCTNCGPRFTITRSLPYDRAKTSMADFTMCNRCQAEFDDPLNRRFHAQPNACWQCGPQAEFVDRNGDVQPGNPVSAAIQALRLGHIVAIKGIGGFHLAVAADQPAAVQELRRRKGRGEKPFALMLATLESIGDICVMTTAEADLLKSPQRPIVLLRKRSSAYDALAPDSHDLGVFLPYAPLHHLLLAEGNIPAVVMTSGNISDEPIAIANDEALKRLGGIADFFLLHNRDILVRCDDSVIRFVQGEEQFVRRSRGFVPSPILLKESAAEILAVGGELKSTICLSRGRTAFVGQHIGDLESLSAFDFFEESIQHLQSILEVQPAIIAHDLHPGYLATQWAKRQPGVRTIAVQHHHAHIASCMAENQLTGTVIGIALDGTGYGSDGQAWGGEILIADLCNFERVAHLAYVPLPGGAKAIREPWRMALAHLWQAFGEDWRSQIPPSWLANVPTQSVKHTEHLLRGGSSLPQTSSCGRLFDAVAALTLGRTHITYEAQAAIALETCCEAGNHGAYPFTLAGESCLEIETVPLFAALAKDLRNEVSPSVISSRFHAGLISTVAGLVYQVAEARGLTRVCLSGGSFQNRILTEGISAKLSELQVFQHRLVPPGDGGLSLGQLAVAANRLLNVSMEG
jgi:hydrogenase maturation protein HypF